MARIFTCGLEWQDVTKEFDTTVGTAPTISTSVKRTGAASLRVSSLSLGTKQGAEFRFANPTTGGPHYFRFYLYLVTLPILANVIAIVSAASGSTTGTRISVDNTGALKLLNSGSVVGTVGTTLSTATWYRVELYMKRVADGSDEMILRVDGDTGGQVSSTSLTLANIAWGFLLLGGNLVAEAHTQGEWHFDDIAINDGTTSDQASFPGAGSDFLAVANGAGEFAATLTLTPGSGEAAWQDVSDVPPDDATTSVAFTSAAADWTAGSRLMVAVTDCATMGIGSSDAITLVYLMVRVAAASASAAGYRPAMQIANGGTKAESAALVSFNVTAWNTNDDTTPRGSKLIRYLDPDGNAWTPTTIDSLQIGIRGQDVTPNFSVTALAAYVEVVPAAVGGTPLTPYHYREHVARAA